jgi:hypothetical protein
MPDELACKLRSATEIDVGVAMANAEFYFDAHPAALLEFYNRMLDVLGVPDAGGDVCQPDE